MATPAVAVAVLGAGSWGTALAALIARHGFPTTLWGRDAAVVAAIDQRHENPRYLPGIPLPEGLRATTDLARGPRAGLVLVPRTLTELRALASPRPPHAGVLAAKGFGARLRALLHEVATERSAATCRWRGHRPLVRQGGAQGLRPR